MRHGNELNNICVENNGSSFRRDSLDIITADTTDIFLVNLDVVFFHLCHDKMDKDSEEQGPQREL